MVAIISFAALNSYQTKCVDEPSGLHATLTGEITINGGSVRARLLNDGVTEWNVTSADVVGEISSCRRLPNSVKSNETVSVRCIATGIDEGASYSIVIYIVDAKDESNKYMLSGMAQAKAT